MLRPARLLVVSRVAAAACSALWLALAARWLRQDDFGDLALLLGLAVVAVAGSDLGHSVALPASVRRAPAAAGTALRRALRQRLLAGSVGAAAVVLLYWAGSERPNGVAAAAIACSVIATAVHTACSAAMRGENHVAPEALGEVLSRVGVLALGAVGLANGRGLSFAAVLYAVADIAVAVLLVRTSCIRFRHRCQPEVPLEGRGALAIGLPLGTAYWRIDVWFVGVLSGSVEVALYGAAYRLLDGFLLPASATGSLVPGEVAAAGPDERWRVMRRLLVFGGAMTTIPAILVMFRAELVLEMLFGPAYAPGAHALVVLMAAAAPSAFVIGATQAVGVVRPAALPVLMGGALVLNVGLNLWLTPRHGAAGAAWATLACQVLLAGALAGQLGGRPPAHQVHVPLVGIP